MAFRKSASFVPDVEDALEAAGLRVIVQTPPDRPEYQKDVDGNTYARIEVLIRVNK